MVLSSLFENGLSFLEEGLCQCWINFGCNFPLRLLEGHVKQYAVTFTERFDKESNSFYWLSSTEEAMKGTGVLKDI